MTYVIVLAERVHEANLYAKRAGLPRGRFRFPTSAASIRGLRVAEIHELPSFSRRRDKHAIDAALRFARGERKMVEMPPKLEEPPVDQGDGMGEQLTIDDLSGDTGNGDNMIAEGGPVPSENGEETRAAEPSEDPAPAPKKRKRKPAPAVNFFTDD